MSNSGKLLVCAIIILIVGMSIIPVMGDIGATNRDDITPPVTACTLDPAEPDGLNDWYVSDVEVTLNATDDMSGVNVTYYRVNNQGWEIYEYPFVFNNSNQYTIEYYSIDNAGNMESVKLASCKVDVVPPVTTVRIHGIWGENGWLKKLDYIEFKATDDMSGVTAVYCRVNGGSWFVCSMPITLSFDGEHVIEYYSVDYAGNAEDVKEVIVKLDATPPEITLTGKKIGVIMWKFTAEALDGISGIDRVEFYIDGQLDGIVYAPGPYEWRWAGSGSHTAQAIAYDFAGNSAASNVVNSIPQSQSRNIFSNKIFIFLLQLINHIYIFLQQISAG